MATVLSGTPSTRDFYLEIDYFFSKDGTDKRGKLFTALNYKGTNFTQALNTPTNPDTIKSEPIFQLMLAKNYDDASDAPVSTDDVKLSNKFVYFVYCLGKAHRTMEQTSGTELLKQISTNWDTMSLDGKVFYKAFINYVASDGQAADLANRADGITGLNFKKVDPNNRESDVLFASTLPYLPSGMKYNGEPHAGYNAGDVVPTDFLHKVYMEGWKTVSTETTLQFSARTQLVGGASYEGWTDIDNIDNIDCLASREKLNVLRFTRNVLYITSVPPTQTAFESSFADLYDMTTGKLYTKDATGEYKFDDVEIRDTEYTGLKSDDLVYECILSGDADKLSRCLGKFTTGDMSKQTGFEITKMHPKNMMKILKTFVVSTADNAVEPYVLWHGSLRARLVSKMGEERGSQTHKSIIGNKKLLEYLRCVINHVGKHPELLSLENGYGNGVESPLPRQVGEIGKAKLNYFVKPKMDKMSSLEANLGVLSTELNLLPQNFMQSVNLPMNLQNMQFGTNQLMGMGLSQGMGLGMRGGAGCVDQVANSLESTYNEILKEMNSKGKDLVQSDKDRILKGIHQIKDNNEKITKALNDLKAFASLNTALTHGLDVVELKDVQRSSSVKLDSQIQNLQSSVNTISTDQVGLMTALVQQVLSPMLLIARGGTTPYLRVI